MRNASTMKEAKRYECRGNFQAPIFEKPRRSGCAGVLNLCRDFGDSCEAARKHQRCRCSSRKQASGNSVAENGMVACGKVRDAYPLVTIQRAGSA